MKNNLSEQAAIDLIEDYIGGNIEGVDKVDRMSFTRFLRSVLSQYALSCAEKVREEAAKICEGKTTLTCGDCADAIRSIDIEKVLNEKD